MLSTHSIRESAAWYMADVLPDMVDHFGQLPDIETDNKTTNNTRDKENTKKTKTQTQKYTDKQHCLEDNCKKTDVSS